MNGEAYGFDGPEVTRHERRVYEVTGTPPLVTETWKRDARDFVPEVVIIGMDDDVLTVVTISGHARRKDGSKSVRPSRVSYYMALPSDVEKMPEWIYPLIKDIPRRG